MILGDLLKGKQFTCCDKEDSVRDHLKRIREAGVDIEPVTIEFGVKGAPFFDATDAVSIAICRIAWEVRPEHTRFIRLGGYDGLT